MDAKKAKQNADNFNDALMKDVFKCILDASNQGKYRVNIPYGVFNVVHSVRQRLEELGYSVKHGGNVLIVSWEK